MPLARGGRMLIGFAALNGAVAVGMGAYASHGLAGDAHAQDLARLAGQYQMWHALALIGTVLLRARAQGPAAAALGLAAGLFVAGIVLFSGTLYAQALSGPLPVPMTAPTGGTALIVGWVAAAVATALPGWGRGGAE